MDKNIAVDFIQLESVPSTNTWAKEHASTFNPLHLTCITAQEQTGGRGRRDKKWFSPKGMNLYSTFYFAVPSSASYLANLGQAMVLASAELLLEMRVPVGIKWPNDLLVHEKKIGGVLTETIPLQSEIGVAIGLGLNVNMTEELLRKIDQPATALNLFLREPIEPARLLQPLLRHFIPCLVQLQSFGFAPLQPRFQRLLCYKGQMITVHLPQGDVQGVCDSITEEGCLRLQLAAGQFLNLSTGEISTTE